MSDFKKSAGDLLVQVDGNLVKIGFDLSWDSPTWEWFDQNDLTELINILSDARNELED